MFDNETPYEWREAAVTWAFATIGWSVVWYIPFVGLAGITTAGEGFFLIIGSVGPPFISVYLLFRTIARMITQAGEDSDDDKWSGRNRLPDDADDSLSSD